VTWILEEQRARVYEAQISSEIPFHVKTGKKYKKVSVCKGI
jgi:hypothetical protein